MRAGLIERGVPAEAIYRDPTGYRTWDSVLRARDVYGQKRLRDRLAALPSQPRAVPRAATQGIEAWGFEARDVDSPYSIFTELRRYPSALRAYFDVWTAHAGATDVGQERSLSEFDPPE